MESKNNQVNPHANAFFKHRILTAGPTPVPDFVLSAMSSSVHYHRGSEFAKIMEETRAMLKTLFGTTEEVMIFSGTGTLAMEGAVQNFFSPGEEVISVNSGKFGDRWSQQAKIYGLTVKEIFVERGRAVDVAAVESQLTPQTKGVFVHSSETSTGVRHPIKQIAKMLKEKAPEALLLVDGVTSVGVFATPMDAWGIDVLVAGSQKALMLPPGLSLGAASKKAWAKCETVKNVRYYNDWRKTKKTALENTGPFTSPVTLVGGLHAVLKDFEKTGYETLYEKAWRLQKATREAVKAMGLELLAKRDEDASPACTSVMSEGLIDTKGFKKIGLTVSGGQDELKGKIIRLGHIGYMDAWDVLCQIVALAKVFEQKGKKVDLAKGLESFWKVIEDPNNQTPEDMR
ncbi:MAG: alanine--glyoxylate aminotransferase family protein [Bdellovibrionota bacterium]